MKKVKFIKSHPDFAYFAGDDAEISTKAAEQLLESKHVEELEDSSDHDDEKEDLAAARARFEELTGEKPGNRKLETLQKAISEAEETAKK